MSNGGSNGNLFGFLQSKPSYYNEMDEATEQALNPDHVDENTNSSNSNENTNNCNSNTDEKEIDVEKEEEEEEEEDKRKVKKRKCSWTLLTERLLLLRPPPGVK